MGSRYITYYPCPKCGKEVEEYDAPSSAMLVAQCESCDWKIRDHYEQFQDENGEWQIEFVKEENCNCSGDGMRRKDVRK